MRLDDQSRRTVEAYRGWIEVAASADLPVPPPEFHDRDDASTLATRWKGGHRLWYEIAIRPFLPQLRVGILTDDPCRSRDFEEMIEATTLTIPEFVAQGFAGAGLPWPAPPVEHYCEQRRWFYFATPLDLRSLDVLRDDAFREKTRRMLIGYHQAFSEMRG